MPEAGLSVPRGQARRREDTSENVPAARSAPGRTTPRDAGRSTNPDPAHRAYSSTARATPSDGARPGPREASRPQPRGAVGRGAAVQRERPRVGPRQQRQPTRQHDRTPFTPAGAAVPGRRTVRIQGRGSERHSPSPNRRRPHRKRHERAGFKPDRTAMWAVLLGVVLILVAATSSHAAVGSRAAAGAHSRVALHAREHAPLRVVSPGTNRSRP